MSEPRDLGGLIRTRRLAWSRRTFRRAIRSPFDVTPSGCSMKALQESEDQDHIPDTPLPSMILSRNLPAFQTSPQRQPRGLPQVLPLGLSQSSRDKAAWPLPPGAWFSVSSQRQPATGSTRTRNSQASATGRTLFGVFHLSSSHLSRMTCAKIPPESWASQCVKKAPHGAELCNHNKKKKEREISPSGSLAGI